MSTLPGAEQEQRKMVIAGFKAVNKIMFNWGCSKPQIQSILAIPEDVYSEFISNADSIALNSEQIERLSHILNIHRALRLKFYNQENVSGFMSLENHNPPFEGHKPLDFISGGSLADLSNVASWLDVNPSEYLA
ncbi:DUF2384 domain-containing protein [Alginatibacterium sediminis]|uniref:DUF2384 domain-containing protein n=1 Tax=Alginatibacterium sediminis TaxID=2164068 RepID=A0A420E7F8_9ALTE|nr:DUF2384 domain-containing protein [Alginatibacterium sediminis]RKF14345.1 DUF2384 domain-containing protein [Alginatibacterium sediminis]